MTRELPDDRSGLSRGSHFSSPGHVPGLQLQLKDGASGGLINHGVVPSETLVKGVGFTIWGGERSRDATLDTRRARAFLPERLSFVFGGGVHHEKLTLLHPRRKKPSTTWGCGEVYDLTLLISLRHDIVIILPSELLAYISTWKVTTDPDPAGARSLRRNQVVPFSSSSGGSHPLRGLRAKEVVSGPKSLHPSALCARILKR